MKCLIKNPTELSKFFGKIFRKKRWKKIEKEFVEYNKALRQIS